MLSLLYLVVRALVRLLARVLGVGRDDGSKDLEILVLRQQLRVLQQKVGPPKLWIIDRVLLAGGQSGDPVRPLGRLPGHSGDPVGVENPDLITQRRRGTRG